MWGALLKAIAAAMMSNAQKSAQGEEANATISPMSLTSAMSGPSGSATMGQGPSSAISPTTAPVDLGTIPIYGNGQGQGQNMNPIPTQVNQKPDVGFIRGMINATTGQPHPEGLNDVSQGRKTAYYAGGVIPNIIMSKLGQPSPAEASARQSMIDLRSGTQPVIDPETGVVKYNRPKGSIFQPPSLEEKNTAQLSLESQKEEQKNQRTTEKGVNEFRGFMKQFERSYDELNKSIPSVGEKGITGTGARLAGKAGEKLGYYPETTAFLKELQPKANMMARTIEGGRITDQDRQVYADSFASALSAPSDTNSRLMANSLEDAYYKGGNITGIMSLLSESQNPVLQGVVTRVNQDIWGGQPQPTQSGGKMDFSTMSTEELLKRKQQLLQGGAR